jgi:hypothetical protein
LQPKTFSLLKQPVAVEITSSSKLLMPLENGSVHLALLALTILLLPAVVAAAELTPEVVVLGVIEMELRYR